LTVLKYPGLVAMFAADAVIVAPVFIISLSTQFWWEGTMFFFSLQSPLIYLLVRELVNERNKWTLPSGGWWTPGKPGEADTRIFEHAAVPERESRGVVASKVFLHGVAYSGLTYLLAFAMVEMVYLWTFLAFSLVGWPAFLLDVGLIVGLAATLILDWFVLGAINTMLTESIWHAEIRHDWKHLLVHGLALTVVCAMASIPILIMYLYFFIFPVVLVEFIVYCFVYGLLARVVAFTWENKGKESDTPEMRTHKRYSTLLNI